MMSRFFSPFYESLLLFCSNLASAALRAFSLRSVKSDGEELPLLVEVDCVPLKLYPLPENTLFVGPRFMEARVGTAKEEVDDDD